MAVAGVLWAVTYSKEGYAIKSDTEVVDGTKNEEEKHPKITLYFGMFIGILALCAIVCNFAKDGLGTWVPAILKESFSMTDSMALLLTIIISFMGIFGALLSNYLFKFIKDCVALTGVLFLGTAICALGVVLLFDSLIIVLLLIFFGLAVMLLHGVNNVITSITPMFMRDKMNSGKAAGILNGFCYLGSTLSTYVLGVIADKLGWDSALTIIFLVCTLPVIIALAWIVAKKAIKTNKREL